MADEPFLIVRTSSSNLRAGSALKDHAHDWHQLIYVASGVVTVSTGAGSWVAPPTWAIWVPAHVRHNIRFVGESALRTGYFKPGAPGQFPNGCTAVTVSPLLRELLIRATDVGMLDRRDPVEMALAALIASEIRESDRSPFTLPQPASAALCRAVALTGGDLTVAALARAAGMASRTFERRFFAETGMTVGRWRQQQSLLHGLEQLATGAPIKAVAAQAGYATPSAFIAAFRKSFGTTPGRYFIG